MGNQPATADAPITIEPPTISPAVVVVEPSTSDMAKRVLRKIDRTIIPLLFVTYMFNFMDKVILSSAAVFGLRDDNVSSQTLSTSLARLRLKLTDHRILKVSSTAG
jgi:hypothetical protein